MQARRLQFADNATEGMLYKYTQPIPVPTIPTRNRTSEIRMIIAHLYNPYYSNVILLGAAGSGKTATVEELVREDPDRYHLYLQVDLSKMSSAAGLSTGSGAEEMGSRLKKLFGQVITYQHQHPKYKIIMFMDEFHIIVDPGASHGESSASQAIKPILARSGRNHIRIIAATTQREYDKYISPDEALNERLRPVHIKPPSNDIVVQILKDMKKKIVPNAYVQPGLFDRIVRVTNKYIIDQVQPRKSVTVFDDMLGWYRAFNTNPKIHASLDDRLLDYMMLKGRGLRIDWHIDVGHIEDYLNQRVLSQQLAAHILTQRLYKSVARLQDYSRPQGSFLFTGSTGVGKTEMAKALAHALFGSDRAMIRFDMSEFSKADSVDTFQYRLAEQEANNPDSIILLDEFEKANVHVARLLLQVLDDAQLTDRNGREISFADSYIILTTNAAKNIYRKMGTWQSDSTSNSWDMDKYAGIVRQDLEIYPSFPSELLGRLDAFIPFAPLSLKTMRIMARMRLADFTRLVKETHNITLHFDPDVLRLLVDEDMTRDTSAGGGRLLMRKISEEVESPIAEYICTQVMAKHQDVPDVAVIQSGNLAVNNKFARVGNGFVSVGPYATGGRDDSRVVRYERGNQ